MFKVVNKWEHEKFIKIEWNLGKRCNLDCSYCPAEIHDNYSLHTDISKIKNCIDQISKLPKPVRLSFTGGEPTVHPKFEEILKYCKYKNIQWISITTNGTRPVKWFENISKYLNQIVFSVHFEQNWEKISQNIINFCSGKLIPCYIHVMAHHDYMDKVQEFCKTLDDKNIPYVTRRIRWIVDSRDNFNDNKYSDQDLSWLLSKTSTIKPNCIIDDSIEMHANDIIKNNYNNFKSWKCNAGLESLMINWDGEVYRATCRVGGSLGNIYNNTFVPPIGSIICTRNWCTCEADIPLTKIKE
jgi:MoaA/NifB/PqqE/SkfB family radical SAM enzyme